MRRIHQSLESPITPKFVYSKSCITNFFCCGHNENASEDQYQDAKLL